MREELDRSHELVIGAESRMELALVVDEAVVAVVQPAEADGGALHVREQALDPGSVVGVQLSVGACGEAGVLPSQEALHGLGEDLLLLEHHLEEPLSEEFLESGEVDVVHGEVAAVVAEEAEGDEGVDVSVGDDEVPERLRGGDHGRDGPRAPGGVRGAIAQVVAGG